MRITRTRDEERERHGKKSGKDYDYGSLDPRPLALFPLHFVSTGLLHEAQGNFDPRSIYV